MDKPEKVAHLPLRPSWDCGTCGKPWPCDPAREHLAAEKDTMVLPIYMVIHLTYAAGELTAAPPGELFERFLAWTRYGPDPAAGEPDERAIGRAQVRNIGRHRTD